MPINLTLLLLFGLCSVSRSQLIGPNGQLCEDPTDPDDNPPDECPILSDGSFTGFGPFDDGVVECEENYDCCTCEFIQCGFADGSSFCEKFVVGGDFGAFGVSGIEIYGDCDDGASIECSGDDSCKDSAISTAECVSEITCGGDRSCFGADFTAECVVDDRCELECGGELACYTGSFVIANTEGLKCSNTGACTFGRFDLLSNEGGKVDCGGTGACFGATIQVTEIEDVICNGDSACNNVELYLLNPKDGVDIECNGDAACSNLNLVVRFDGSADSADGDLELGNILCDGTLACQGANIELLNENCAEVATFEKLDCSDEDSCALLNIDSTGCGSFTIEECDCGDDNQGCVDATGLAAVCLNIDATEEPTTTTTTPTDPVLSCSNAEVGPFVIDVPTSLFVIDVEIIEEGLYVFELTQTGNCSDVTLALSSDNNTVVIEQTDGTPIGADLDDGTYALDVFVNTAAGQTCTLGVTLTCFFPTTSSPTTPSPTTPSPTTTSTPTTSPTTTSTPTISPTTTSTPTISPTTTSTPTTSPTTTLSPTTPSPTTTSTPTISPTTTLSPTTPSPTTSPPTTSPTTIEPTLSPVTVTPVTTSDSSDSSDSDSSDSDSNSDSDSDSSASDSSDSSDSPTVATSDSSDSSDSDSSDSDSNSDSDSDSSASDSSDSDSDSNSDSDSSDSDSSDSDSDSDSDSGDMSTTVLDDADFNDGAAAASESFARALGSESSAANGLLATEENADADAEHVTVSLSKETLMNLWALCAVVMAVNVALCVWCHCKKKAQSKQRFVEDEYVSDVNNV